MTATSIPSPTPIRTSLETLADGLPPPPHELSPAERRRRTEEVLRERAEVQDEAARQQLEERAVVLNLDVVRSVSSRFSQRGVHEDDLLQVACVGLVKAIKGFDPDAGHAFLSFAVPTIRGEVRRHFRDRGWTVRPPRAIQELQASISWAEDELAQELGRPPRPSEVARHLDAEVDDVVEAMAAKGCFSPASLDAPVGGDGPAVGELLPMDDVGPQAAEARVLVGPAVSELGERDRRVLYLRFFEGLTQREIGEQLGVTQMQVSRILSRILRQLRESIEDPSQPTRRAAGAGGESARARL